jgi:putative mRNA 3-end processing factor
VLSDHADWDGLLAAVSDSQAEEVWVTHGFDSELVRYLNERGCRAKTFTLAYPGETDED